MAQQQMKMFVINKKSVLKSQTHDSFSYFGHTTRLLDCILQSFKKEIIKYKNVLHKCTSSTYLVHAIRIKCSTTSYFQVFSGITLQIILKVWHNFAILQAVRYSIIHFKKVVNFLSNTFQVKKQRSNHNQKETYQSG